MGQEGARRSRPQETENILGVRSRLTALQGAGPGWLWGGWTRPDGPSSPPPPPPARCSWSVPPLPAACSRSRLPSSLSWCLVQAHRTLPTLPPAPPQHTAVIIAESSCGFVTGRDRLALILILPFSAMKHVCWRKVCRTGECVKRRPQGASQGCRAQGVGRRPVAKTWTTRGSLETWLVGEPLCEQEGFHSKSTTSTRRPMLAVRALEGSWAQDKCSDWTQSLPLLFVYRC